MILVVLGNFVLAWREDGLLEAWERMQMDVRVELVVLSACDSGRGRVSPGAGLIGMSCSLFLAGTPSTVASQWKVGAASTTGGTDLGTS